MTEYKGKCSNTLSKLNEELLKDKPLTEAETGYIMRKLDREVAEQEKRIHPRTPYQIFSEIVTELRPDDLAQEYVLRLAVKA